MKSDHFNPRALRSVLEQQVAASIPDADMVMSAARRATRWPEESLGTVEEWIGEVADSSNSVDVASAFLMGWRLGGKVPSASLIQALVDRVERIGIDRIGASAANTAVLALMPATEEIGGPVAERVRNILRLAARHRRTLRLQAGAMAALQEMFGNDPEFET